MISGLLLDFDDTLYDYAPCEAAGRARLAAVASVELGVDVAAFHDAYDAARARVKARCATPSNHSRLLYLHDLVHQLAPPGSLQTARVLERVFWDGYLSVAFLRAGALDLVQWFRGHGGKVGVVTDLTLDVQLRKLEHLGLLPHLDALAASEEVGHDKPHRGSFDLVAERMGVPLAQCAMVGDHDGKDGAGARALEIPFYLVRTATSDVGLTLPEIHADLARKNRWKN